MFVVRFLGRGGCHRITLLILPSATAMGKGVTEQAGATGGDVSGDGCDASMEVVPRAWGRE